MGLKTVGGWVLMWTFSLSYFGICLSTHFASDDIFVNMAVMGIFEIPSALVSSIVSHRLGRRLPSLWMAVVSSAILFTLPFIRFKNHLWILTTVACLGKLILTTAYNISITYVGELHPTCIRNVGFFSSLLFSSVGSLLAPQVNALSGYFHWLPNIIFGLHGIVASLTFIFLPETLGSPLVQTVPEADLLVVGKEKDFRERLRNMHATVSLIESEGFAMSPLDHDEMLEKKV